MPSPELVEKVGELAKRLDGKAEPANPNSGINNTSLDVCPEEFKGGTFGYPYFPKVGSSPIVPKPNHLAP